MRRLALTVAAGLVIGYLVLNWIAQRVMYFPSRYPEGWWSEQHSLGAEDVWLTAADGTRLHVWWIPAPGAKVATLHLHGNGGNLTHRSIHAKALVEAGSSVLLVDYRGYGRSEGSPSESGLYQDAEAAWNWIAQRGLPVVIHGESLGTAVAVNLAVERPCKGVVLEMPFTSAGEMAQRVIPYVGGWVVTAYPTLSRVGRLHSPLLVIHGTKDDLVPFEMGRRVFEAAPEPKWFWAVEGAGHNDLILVAWPEYANRLRAFYDSL